MSSYLIDTKLENTDQHMLIHGYTGAMDIVKDELATYLSSTSGFFSKEDLPCSDATANLLEERGYITQKTQEEEYAYVERLATALHRKDRILNACFTFLITYNCNFRCPYCFEKDAVHDLMRQKVFTKEMVDKAYEAIMKIEPREQLRVKTIDLYGGEPLLKENKEIISYIVQKGKDLGFKFRATTNGYDLDFFEDLLSPYLIFNLQITIDGIKDIHNQKRIHYEGFPTFDRIVSNIGIALKKNVQVLVRVNTDKNNFNSLLPLTEMFDNLHYTNNKYFKIDSALLRNNDKYFDKNSDYFTQREFFNAHQKLKFRYGCQSFGVYTKVYDAITKQKPLHLKATSCGSQVNGFIFDPFGKIYPCWEMVGKEAFQIGDYNSEDIKWNNSVLKKWRDKNILTLNSCRYCKYALLCGGGCAARNLETLEYCTNMSVVLNYVVNLAFRNVQNKYFTNLKNSGGNNL